MINTVQTDRGKTFDAYLWSGNPNELPPWLADCPIEHIHYHGDCLCVGAYLVRVGRWVLRSHERGDIFPVPNDMFPKLYTPVEAHDV
jgi:hypothetical protein